MKQSISTFFIGSLLFIFSSLSFAGEQYTKRGYAVSGYDPVAYFTIGEPTKGDKNISAEWNDVKWLFSTEEHKNLFLANPEKYAPAYDGHCAFAAGIGKKVSAKPTLWKIIDDRLFLNFSKAANKRWLDNPESYIKDGDENWKELGEKPAA
ncbi:twin-arginine translocation pathway signal sequence domain protein [gamma proteobacterium IMCC1989]|nr:twin-arginine translocation pathway signal sequence domain protein [gamma proteobacterium IMCC1989]